MKKVSNMTKDSFLNQVALQQATSVQAIRQKSHLLSDTDDLDMLIDKIGSSKLVLLGEASHGTHDYYTWRSAITKRLIVEKDFNFIAVEGDWPDCYRLNRYIKHYSESGASAYDVLHSFNRWPTWMWANWEMVALGEWLHKHNLFKSKENKIGFYGLDVYSLWESLEAIIHYLRRTNPKLVETAQEAISCFEPFKKDEGLGYARANMLVPKLCEPEVLKLLKDLRSNLPSFNSDHESAFSTEQNAYVAVNAEKYYRAMLKGGSETWNIRDQHMADTLKRLLAFHGEDAKAIVWEHNTHIGDARATDMSQEGMFNLGELVRIEYSPEKVSLVGFGSYRGTVLASEGWGRKMQVMEVPEAKKGSWEYLLHEASHADKLLLMEDFMTENFLKNGLGHRAIGVVYHPEREHLNYVPSILPLRYDAFIYLDHTRALNPLHIETDKTQIPETYPFGI